MTRRMSTIINVVVACAGLASAAGAQGGPPAGGPPGGPMGGAPAGARAGMQAAGRISGSVINARSSQPMAQAAVSIRGGADSALVGGGFTKADGTFRIEG